MKEDDDAIEGNRKDRYRSVKALAFGDGPRKSYLISTLLAPFRINDRKVISTTG
jgi:hypothetical protein